MLHAAHRLPPQCRAPAPTTSLHAPLPLLPCCHSRSSAGRSSTSSSRGTSSSPQHAIERSTAAAPPATLLHHHPHDHHQHHHHRRLASASGTRQVAANFAGASSVDQQQGSSSSSSNSRRGGTGVGSSSSRTKLRVAVDVDEVLGRFLHSLNQFCRETKGMDHQIAEFAVYEFAKVWLCDQDTSNRIVHEFFQSQHFTEGIPVIPGAYEALTRMAQNEMDLVVVTSRQHVIQDQTLAWIDKHFPGVFQEVYFGNHWSLEGPSRKKSEICNTIGASVLIDDNPGYAFECAEAGIHVLLYDWHSSYPWSKLPAGSHHPLITVVHNWEEVEVQLERLAPQLLSSSGVGEHPL